MNQIRDYLVPDYYPSFSCKMGACRTPCCEGWPISFSLDDYFRLLSAECSPELRRRLDVSLHMAEHPTPDAYAQISPRYDGKCPLHMEDGRCALHAELGEEMLSAVCRLYPRGVRAGLFRECSCANSCEAVLELLLHRDAPLTFSKIPLAFDIPEPPPRQFHFETADHEEEIRLWLIAHMQNRAWPLPQRLLALGNALHAMDDALTSHDAGRVDRLLSGEETIAAPDALTASHEQFVFGLDTANRLLEIMDARSESIRDYGAAALEFFGCGQVEFIRYKLARQHFESILPQWELWFEHMLVNHMFFAQFPFQDRPVNLKDEYISLCAVYILLRFLCIGWMAGQESADAAVDVAAAAFRLIEHTEFDRYAAPVLKEIGCTDWDRLHQLLCL